MPPPWRRTFTLPPAIQLLYCWLTSVCACVFTLSDGQFFFSSISDPVNALQSEQDKLQTQLQRVIKMIQREQSHLTLTPQSQCSRDSVSNSLYPHQSVTIKAATAQRQDTFQLSSISTTRGRDSRETGKRRQR